MIRSKKVRNAARGEQCTLQIVGVCSGNPETTVACHLPDESHGMGLKAHDIVVCFGCSACHAVIDGAPCAEFQEHRLFYLFRAWKRTLARLVELGIVRLA